MRDPEARNGKMWASRAAAGRNGRARLHVCVEWMVPPSGSWVLMTGIASGVGRGLASACSVGGGTAADGAKGVVAITAVALPAWYPAWLAVVSREERSCSASVKST